MLDWHLGDTWQQRNEWWCLSVYIGNHCCVGISSTTSISGVHLKIQKIHVAIYKKPLKVVRQPWSRSQNTTAFERSYQCELILNQNSLWMSGQYHSQYTNQISTIYWYLNWVKLLTSRYQYAFILMYLELPMTQQLQPLYSMQTFLQNIHNNKTMTQCTTFLLLLIKEELWE